MSKTNTEKMAPETQTPEMANGMKLDVRVRPIAPMGNLLAFANVTIGGCFKIDGFRICSSRRCFCCSRPMPPPAWGCSARPCFAKRFRPAQRCSH